MLAYDRSEYRFADPAAFGGRAPWESIEHLGVAVPLGVALRDGWGLGVTPTVDVFREAGADARKALGRGGVVAATRRRPDGDRLGFGAGVFHGLERTRVFPFVLVDIALGDRWRLANPLPAGPTGPAGLEIDYRFDNDWRLGLGAAWRTARFRLRADGPVPNGIGEERAVPLFLRATRSLGAGASLHLYAGSLLGGRLRLADEGGHVQGEARFDRAPLFAATLAARF